MGFVYFHMSPNMLPKPLLTLLQLLEIILYSFAAALYWFGLNPSFESEARPWDVNEELLFSAEPAPAVLAEAALVKSRLPAVEFVSLVGRRGAASKTECLVCLQVLEARDRVRELGNCRHAFHVGCIDRWVDLGRFSCPLCRSGLLPSAGTRKGMFRFNRS